MESKYISCSAAIQEGVWLKRIFRELGIVTSASQLTTVNCGSMTALAYAKNSKYHEKTKHIDIRYHFIQDKHISTSCMVVGPLTKLIAWDVYQAHVKSLELHRM